MIFSKSISYEDIVKNLDKENDVISMIVVKPVYGLQAAVDVKS